MSAISRAMRMRRRRRGHVLVRPSRKPPPREWTLLVEYKGLPDERDDKIRRLVGRGDVGTGFMFATRERDLEFRFKRESAARAALARVRAARVGRARLYGP